MNTASSASATLGTPFPAPAGTAASAVKAAAAPKDYSKYQSPAQVREHAYRLATLFLVGDFVVALLASYAGVVFRDFQREGWSLAELQATATHSHTFIWTLSCGVLFTWLMLMVKAYDTTALLQKVRWLSKTVKVTALWCVLILAFIGFFTPSGFQPRIGLLYSAAALLFGQFCWRTFAFAFLTDPAVVASARSKVIIVGWNEQAARLRRAIREDHTHLREIVGCVPLPGGKFGTTPPPDVAVLGDYSALPELVRQCEANSIILAESHCPAAEIHNLIDYCQRELIAFRLMPDYFPALVSGLQVQSINGVPLLGISQLPFDHALNRVYKRAIDIVGGCVGLFLATPVIWLFCAIVYWESRGPVFYKQIRTTRNGRPFYIYKIRSMRMDAETQSGAVWCKKEDPRRLRIGAFMRKTNIDELPQFYNVIKGDMSLVGPRPERPELIEKFKDSIPNYNARHHVRAGVTGWAQIHGLRGDTDLADRIRYDLWYLEHWHPLLDFYIMAATFLKNKNAH